MLPPATLLWVTFHDRNDSFVLLIPVVVMAAGQLAGGLAWLSIFGEDAPDLCCHRADWLPSHPLGQDRSGHRHDHVCAPIVAVLTLGSAFAGVVCALGILSAAAAATAIQLCFPRAGAPQSVSPLAFFFWAATTALAASASWAALGTAVVAFGVLAAVWLISPSRA